MANDIASNFIQYRRLLEYLHSQSTDFVTFDKVNKSPICSNGSRSVALRYDIHLRDIENAYKMHEVELEVLERVVSTSFVMWGLAGSTMLEALTEIIHARQYDKYVAFCLLNDVEVQPHISPLNDYIRRNSPTWCAWDENQIIEAVKRNYLCETYDDGIDLIVVDHDVLNLEHLNKQIVDYLNEYDFLWHAKYSIEPKGYAVHGNALPFNRVLTNGVLLNQRCIKKAYPNRFEVHSSEIRKELSLYSDCTLPYWMWDEPQFSQKNLQLLIHPAQWDSDSIRKKFIKASPEQLAHRHLTYPYATPLDTIIDPLDFINSGLGRYEYSTQTNSSFYL